MEGIPLIETVYEAIETLYHNPDCNKKNDANRWLIDLQKSVIISIYNVNNKQLNIL